MLIFEEAHPALGIKKVDDVSLFDERVIVDIELEATLEIGIAGDWSSQLLKSSQIYGFQEIVHVMLAAVLGLGGG